jgi:hypothetical protein
VAGQGKLHSPVIRLGSNNYDYWRFARLLDLPGVDEVEPAKRHARQQDRNVYGPFEKMLGLSGSV